MRSYDDPLGDFSLAEADRQARRLRCSSNPEYREIDDYYRTSYLPKCRKTYGASALPSGQRYYAFQVRQQTTTTLTPNRIHPTGSNRSGSTK